VLFSFLSKSQNAPAINWQRCLGGSGGEIAYSIQQTIEGGYVVVGVSDSNDGDLQANQGSHNGDYWIVKLDGNGNIQWQKTFGGSDSDYATSVKQTSDGGYMIAGNSLSNNGDVSGNHSSFDYCVIKLDNTGSLQWQKTLGGSGDDYANSVDQSVDGGFVVCGYTSSNDGDVSGNHGSEDYWVVKLTSLGNIQWQKCLGGMDYDNAFD